MICPKCSAKTRVYDTLFSVDENEMIRRRICKNEKCGYKFYSIEYLAEENDMFKKQLKNSVKGGR